MLVHPELDSVFPFPEEQVCTLVIENQDFFRRFLTDLTEQISGLDGEAVLSVQNTPVPLASFGELIDSYPGFSINRKPLVNKVISRMEREAVTERWLQTAELLTGVERLVEDLSDSVPCDLVCGKLSVGSVLRGVGLEIVEEGTDPLERLLDYMELVREFDRESVRSWTKRWSCSCSRFWGMATRSC